MFLDRWSPRSFSGEPIDEALLMTILEAASWAPSAANRQPWRFIYFLRDETSFPQGLDLLDAGNQIWVKSASALVFIVSDTLGRRPDGTTSPLRSHSFDAGAAWAMLALQALKSGLAAHAMGGVDFERAASVLQVPADHKIEAAVAIGRLADKSLLPENLRLREVPSERRPLDQMVFRHIFGAG
ncbi:nitroreductase family protein [Pseudomonas sp. R2.Fl]|nr:nitroreductase family protein [Pseudomonas sp. R2.Fl]